jgi:hypothetical protein
VRRRSRLFFRKGRRRDRAQVQVQLVEGHLVATLGVHRHELTAADQRAFQQEADAAQLLGVVVRDREAVVVGVRDLRGLCGERADAA